MKDIRINKKKFHGNIMDLSFFKINFMFFSGILKKYKGNKYVESLISQKIPLIFLIKSDNNESILKSVSDILELLKRKNGEEKSANALETTLDENNSAVNTFSNKNYIENISNATSINNQYERTDLTYNYEKKDDRILEILESIVVNIKKNLKLGNQKLNSKKTELQKQKTKEIKESPKDPKQVIEKNKVSIRPELKNQNSKTKIENIKEIPKIPRQEKEKTQIDSKEENQQVLKTLNLKRITSHLEKINEKIINRNIQKARINKINYDFISKDKNLSKNIYNKVSSTLLAIINKNRKIKHFSEVSKSLVFLNKKFKTENIVKELQNVIKKSKTENKKSKINSTKSQISFKNILDNTLTYKNNFESSNLFSSASSVHSDILRRFFYSLDFKNKISKNKISDRYYKKISSNNFSKIFDKKIRINDVNLVDSFLRSSKHSILDNTLTYKNNFESSNLFSSASSVHSDILRRFFYSLDFKNKISKNKISDRYYKKISSNNFSKIFDKKIRINDVNLVDSFLRSSKHSLVDNTLTYKNNFESSNLFSSASSVHSDILRRFFYSLDFKNKISKNKISDRYYKKISANNFLKIFDKKIRINNFNLVDSFLRSSKHSLVDNTLTYKNNFESSNLFSSASSVHSDILRRFFYSLDFKNKISKNTEKFSKISGFSKYIRYGKTINNDFIQKINKSKIFFEKFKTHKNYSEINFNNIFSNTGEKKTQELESYLKSSHIIYRQKIDVEKILEDKIDKQYKKQNQKNIRNVNSKLQNTKNDTQIFQNKQKKTQTLQYSNITRDEVNKIIKSYIESINFKKISDAAVSEVGNKINLEKYRNGIV